MGEKGEGGGKKEKENENENEENEKKKWERRWSKKETTRRRISARRIERMIKKVWEIWRGRNWITAILYGKRCEREGKEREWKEVKEREKKRKSWRSEEK